LVLGWLFASYSDCLPQTTFPYMRTSASNHRHPRTHTNASPNLTGISTSNSHQTHYMRSISTHKTLHHFSTSQTQATKTKICTICNSHKKHKHATLQTTLKHTPTINSTNSFNRQVVTHFLADSNLHGHRPTIYTNQSPQLHAHSQTNHNPSPVLLTKTSPPTHTHLTSLGSRTQDLPTILETIRFTARDFSRCYPEGNFGRNQLLDSSISLSPLYTSPTNDLHVSNASAFHQSLNWLHPAQA